MHITEYFENWLLMGTELICCAVHVCRPICLLITTVSWFICCLVKLQIDYLDILLNHIEPDK